MDTNEVLNVDPSEKVLFVVKQHRFVIWSAVFVGFFVVVGILIGFIIAVNLWDDGSMPFGKPILAAITFLAVVVAMGSTFISVWVHTENELIVTNENVIQKLQFGIFSSRVSQLNLSKVQDVTVNQHGIIAGLLDYGTIDVETAGEASNYHFKYAPNPNVVAKRIIEAHEAYVISVEREGNAATDQGF